MLLINGINGNVEVNLDTYSYVLNFSLDDTTEVLSSSDFSSSSPFEILSLNNSPRPKLVKNLKEFWQIGKSMSHGSDSTASSKYSGISVGNSFDMEPNGQVFLEDDEASDIIKSTDVTSIRGESQDNSTKVNMAELDRGMATTTIKEKLNSSGNHSQEKSMNGLHKHHSDPDLQSASKSKSGTGDGLDTEYDSGHCCGESAEFDEHSLEEPEFRSGDGRTASKVPSPDELGGGNPFLMFLCLTMLTQHRDHIIRNQMDYNETAMYFDKMTRKHNVNRVLCHARQLYSTYLKQNATRV